jgi:septum site-determining protein MinC
MTGANARVRKKDPRLSGKKLTDADHGRQWGLTMHAPAESEVAATLRRVPRSAAFELKGVMTSLAVLRLASLDLALIERQLRIKIAQLPGFFQDAPVVLDFGAMPEGGAEVPMGMLIALLRGCRLIPVGITNASDVARAMAVAEGIGIMPYRATPTTNAGRASAPVGHSAPVAASPDPRMRAEAARVRPEMDRAAPARAVARAVEGPRPGADRHAVAPQETPAPSQRPPLVIRQAVRSGQVIYAQHADLVVLAPVNPGAEVIADGHVHIYSTLRGRAVAGAQGFAEARIFCQRLEAELVAVAGAYIMADDIPPERRGLPTQIYLDGGECRIAAL